jgi:hypothetical protein
VRSAKLGVRTGWNAAAGLGLYTSRSGVLTWKGAAR